MTRVSFWLVTLHNPGLFIPGWGRTFGSNFVVSNAPRNSDAIGKEEFKEQGAYDITATLTQELQHLSE